MVYDVAIVGAGIHGCTMAHALHKQKQKVLLIDMDSIASGGSGAAGAFIAPKFSKAGELKVLIDEAFTFSMNFYERTFPALFTKTKLIHTSQDGSETFTIDAGLVNAKAMCEALCEGIDCISQEIHTLQREEDIWLLNGSIKAKKVILTTGAYKHLIEEPYIQLRGIWGHRIDVKTSTNNPHALHRYVSISPSENGVLSIGATHNVHYHPQTATQAYDIQAGREELLEKASAMLDLEDLEVLKDYTGLRSGSHDYLPLVGSLVLSKETLMDTSIALKVKRPAYETFHYYTDLYMLNGSGGYGFVLAPYLSMLLSAHILEAKALPSALLPARFFARWARKL